MSNIWECSFNSPKTENVWVSPKRFYYMYSAYLYLCFQVFCSVSVVFVFVLPILREEKKTQLHEKTKYFQIMQEVLECLFNQTDRWFSHYMLIWGIFLRLILACMVTNTVWDDSRDTMIGKVIDWQTGDIMFSSFGCLFLSPFQVSPQISNLHY